MLAVVLDNFTLPAAVAFLLFVATERLRAVSINLLCSVIFGGGLSGSDGHSANGSIWAPPMCSIKIEV